MKYKRKGTVEAVKWFPKPGYDEAYDPSGVEYTDHGWFLDGVDINAGDFIVREGQFSYVMTPEEFTDEFEVADDFAPKLQVLST